MRYFPAQRGCRQTVEVEPDRAKAIALAMTKARAGDIVVIAGKGHEKTQTIGSRYCHSTTLRYARQALAWLKGSHETVAGADRRVDRRATRHPHGVKAGEATGYSIDTRTLASGDLFSPSAAKRFDGA